MINLSASKLFGFASAKQKTFGNDAKMFVGIVEFAVPSKQQSEISCKSLATQEVQIQVMFDDHSKKSISETRTTCLVLSRNGHLDYALREKLNWNEKKYHNR